LGGGQWAMQELNRSHLFAPALANLSHQRFEVTIEQSICATMAEIPVIAQAVGTEQGAASESQNRNSATAGMFSDLTVDV